ncbi:MAG: NAD(P)-dependent oxidoreductase [Anaerolineales bacterium]
MKVLLTGAFGNIGQSALDVLLKRGHQVRCFDLKTKANVSVARAYGKRAQIFWGDLRRTEDLIEALRDVQVVVHLAFVIPTLSVTGVSSEADPEWAREINVGGMKNLLEAMKQQPLPPKILFSSSLHIYGKTQHLSPPRTISDIPHPIEHYAKHKVECEEMIQRSGFTWTIFRLGASLPTRLVMDPEMFEVPLNNRIEFVHRRDVGIAIANGLETDEVWGKIWHIGGGPDCQLYQRELVEGVLEAVGVGMLPEETFTDEPYPTDWLDTKESQRILNFQRRTLSDYIEDVRKRAGFRLFFIRLFRPIIRVWILSKSRAQT